MDPTITVLTAPQRRAWAVTTAVLGIASFAVLALFLRLPQVGTAYSSGQAAAAMSAFQLADGEAALQSVFGAPADPLVVAALDAMNRLDLYVFIPVYALFLLMAGPLVTRRLDTPITALILGAVVVGVAGDVVETRTQLRMTADLTAAPQLLGQLAVGAWMKFFGLAVAAMGCAVACVIEKPRRLGIAFGGTMQVLSTLAGFYAPAQFGAGIGGSVAGFCFGLLILAIQESLAGLRVRLRRRSVIASGTC